MAYREALASVSLALDKLENLNIRDISRYPSFREGTFGLLPFYHRIYTLYQLTRGIDTTPKENISLHREPDFLKYIADTVAEMQQREATSAPAPTTPRPRVAQPPSARPTHAPNSSGPALKASKAVPFGLPW